jgi:hypothetical protein
MDMLTTLRAFLWGAVIGMLVFTATVFLTDPAGPTTIGREYLPPFMGAVGHMVAVLVLAVTFDPAKTTRNTEKAREEAGYQE